MDCTALSQLFTTELRLESPPIAMGRVDEPPRGVPSKGLAPSACTFWREAETSVFFASAEAHHGCPIGAMVLGFDLPEPVADDLQQTVAKMGSVGYVEADEAQRIPTFSSGHRGMLYGPLAEFPLEPEVVLMWLTPAQAMLYAEAAGSVRWTGDTPARFFGRPACAALPASVGGNGAALSLGCTGMRTFTEVGGDRLLAALSGGRIQSLADDLVMTVEANSAMRSAYEERKARVTAEATRV